jgi:hypothetical protein
MAASIPTVEPEQITVGDTIKWTKSLSDYPASEGWTLSYTFVNSSGTFSVTSTADGDDHAVSVSSTTSSSYTAGTYSWQSYATSSSERHQVDAGTIILNPNFADGATDSRSHAKKVLDAIESVIEGRASEDAAAMSIAGRSITKMTLEELISTRSKYRAEYNRELRAERIAQGLGGRKKVLVRFKG